MSEDRRTILYRKTLHGLARLARQGVDLSRRRGEAEEDALNAEMSAYLAGHSSLAAIRQCFAEWERAVLNPERQEALFG